MKKRNVICILLLFGIILSFGGCGSSESSKNNDSESESVSQEVSTEQMETVDEEAIKAELDMIYEDILDMDEKSQYIADNILDYWDTSGQWTFEGLFDKSYGSSAKQSWKTMRDNVFLYREDIKKYQSSIKESLRDVEVTEELKEYKEALDDFYIEANAFAMVIVEYPEGYNKITYSQLISDYKAEAEKLKSVVELKK